MSNVVDVLHDSILNGVGVTVDENWFQQTKDWYNSYNFQVSWNQLGVNGRTMYEVAPTGFVKGGYVVASRPAIVTTENSTYALNTDLCDILIVETTTNMVGSAYTTPNPSGFNDQSDETMDICNAIQVEADALGKDVIFCTPPPRPDGDQTKVDASNVIAQRMKEDLKYILDINEILGDGTINNYQLDKYFSVDTTHYNLLANTRIRYFLQQFLDTIYKTRG
jgi:hypothetical protein